MGLFTKDIKTMDDLYLHVLQDIYYAENQIVKSLPDMIENATDAELKRFNETIAMFRKYGSRYSFDPLMLAAQGYQESQLNQGAKSHVGAIGIMQVMPATGTELKVGDITIAENNVHAGTKYMDQLMTKYFPDAKFSDVDRPLFAFASYNAGPGRISQMRKVSGLVGRSSRVRRVRLASVTFTVSAGRSPATQTSCPPLTTRGRWGRSQRGILASTRKS